MSAFRRFSDLELCMCSFFFVENILYVYCVYICACFFIYFLYFLCLLFYIVFGGFVTALDCLLYDFFQYL